MEWTEVSLVDREKEIMGGVAASTVPESKPRRHLRWKLLRKEGQAPMLWIDGPGNAGFAFSVNWTNLLLGAALGTLALSAGKSKRKGKHHENRHLRRHL